MSPSCTTTRDTTRRSKTRAQASHRSVAEGVEPDGYCARPHLCAAPNQTWCTRRCSKPTSRAEWGANRRGAGRLEPRERIVRVSSSLRARVVEVEGANGTVGRRDNRASHPQAARGVAARRRHHGPSPPLPARSHRRGSTRTRSRDTGGTERRAAGRGACGSRRRSRREPRARSGSPGVRQRTRSPAECGPDRAQTGAQPSCRHRRRGRHRVEPPTSNRRKTWDSKGPCRSSAFAPTFQSYSAPPMYSCSLPAGRGSPAYWSRRWRSAFRSLPLTSPRFVRPWIRQLPSCRSLRSARTSRAISSGVLRDPDEALNRATRAQRRFTEHFTMERVTDAMLAFYERALGEARSAPSG